MKMVAPKMTGTVTMGKRKAENPPPPKEQGAGDQTPDENKPKDKA